MQMGCGCSRSADRNLHTFFSNVDIFHPFFFCFFLKKEINRNLETMRVPFLILHGDQDRLCNVEGSRQLYKMAVTSDKQLKVFEGSVHNLYIEPEDVRKEGTLMRQSGTRQIHEN